MVTKDLLLRLLPVLDKYCHDPKFCQTHRIESGTLQSTRKEIFLIILRALFGKMLLSWHILNNFMEVEIIFPNLNLTKIPSEIMDIFKQYSFLEADSCNQEMIILSPEIFSDLFEQFLETERYKTGSFYTPNYITNFMSRVSLNRILFDHLQQNCHLIDITNLEEISSLPREKILEIQREAGFFLSNINICDPACGTGRFLVATATYLDTLISKFCPFGASPSKNNVAVDIIPDLRIYLRKYILEHSIYGVEKDPIAAEICKLRLLAWFYESFSTEPQKIADYLPTINHIKVGNSLIGISHLDANIQKKYLIKSKLETILCETTHPVKRKSLEQAISCINADVQLNLSESLLDHFVKSGIEFSPQDLENLQPFHWAFEFGLRFTLVIGNPPYGNILSKPEKDFLHKQDQASDEIYVNFLHRILEDKIPFQYASFLTPKSFLLRQNYREFRHMLLTTACPFFIYDIGAKKFKGALNEVQVLNFHRNPSYSPTLTVANLEEQQLTVFSLQDSMTVAPPIDKLRVCFNPSCKSSSESSQFVQYMFSDKCPDCGNPSMPLHRLRIKLDAHRYSLIEHIERIGDLNLLNPRDFPLMKRGEEDQGLKHVRTCLQEYDPSLCAFVLAKNDFSAYQLRPQRSLDLSKVQTQKNPRYYESGPKLLIKHNSIVPEATFTRETTCFTAAIYSLLHPAEETLKYLCGILNSTLLQFYCIFGINNQSLVTMNLNQYMIRHLPIIPPNRNLSATRRIVNFVDEILERMQKTTNLWDEHIQNVFTNLDQEIYTLYEITSMDTINYMKKSVNESMQVFAKTRRRISTLQ